jgi:uncharacterized protein (DUF302 family)
MSYTIKTIVTGTFSKVEKKIREELANEGFGIVTEIDMPATLKKKLDVDYPKYSILGACNPKFAHQALGIDPLIGTLLPCNIIIRELATDKNGTGQIEVAAIDPKSLMMVTDNEELKIFAEVIESKLRRAIEALAV